MTVTASLLLSPLLWDHYLAMLAIPAAFLAERGRPIALALPLLAWLPGESLPFLVILATLLPFWARIRPRGPTAMPPMAWVRSLALGHQRLRSRMRPTGRPRLDWRLVAAVAVGGLGLILLVIALRAFETGPNWALDYLAYRDAALRLAAEGSLYSSLTVSGPFHPGPTGLYLYPPPLGIAVTPLAWSSFEDGALAWDLLHLASLAAACALMPVRPSIRLASFGVAALSFAVLRDLAMGNVSVLLLLPLAGRLALAGPAGRLGGACTWRPRSG